MNQQCDQHGLKFKFKGQFEMTSRKGTSRSGYRDRPAASKHKGFHPPPPPTPPPPRRCSGPNAATLKTTQRRTNANTNAKCITSPAPSLSTTAHAHTQRELEVQVEEAQRSRIKSLEVEVEGLKQRLDELRRAKSTTIVKREREEIRILPPNLGCFGRSSSSSDSTHTHSLALAHDFNPAATHVHAIVQKPSPKLHQLPLSPRADGDVNSGGRKDLAPQRNRKSAEGEKEEVEELKERLGEEQRRHKVEVSRLTEETEKQMAASQRRANKQISTLKDELERMKNETAQREEEEKEAKDTKSVDDSNSAELLRLQDENVSLERQLSALTQSNVDLQEDISLLQDRCDALMEELSIKEARWTQREEELTAEIRQQWGERYHQWIVKAEKKMEELQKLNTILQAMVKSRHAQQ